MDAEVGESGHQAEVLATALRQLTVHRESNDTYVCFEASTQWPRRFMGVVCDSSLT
jgi:hypothetical protein